MIKAMLLAVAGLFAFTAPAHAYIDPGTGTFLLQILAAVFFGALFYLRRIRDFFARLVRPRKPDTGKPDNRKSDEAE